MSTSRKILSALYANSLLNAIGLVLSFCGSVALLCTISPAFTPSTLSRSRPSLSRASSRPCLVANEDFRETLGWYADELLFLANNPADLAAKLSAMLEKSAAERTEIGAYLRGQVERLHCLPRLAERILDLL
jgi:hypothetical protein